MTDHDQKRQLYNRQEYVVGAEAQARYGATTVLVVGADGLAAEIVKNLALTGVRCIKILDASSVMEEDFSTNFFLRQADVGKSRAVVMAHAASELNRFVQVEAVDGCAADHYAHVQVVVFANQHVTSLSEEDALARAKGVRFVACESRGIAGCVFVDAGDEVEVFDTDGEETAMCIVTAMMDDGLITLHDDRQHDCEVGSRVFFTGVQEPANINAHLARPHDVPADEKCFVVEQVVSPYILKLKGLGAALASSPRVELGSSAYLHTTKKRALLHHQPLAESLAQPNIPTMAIFDGEAKMAAPANLHAIFKAVGATKTIPRSAPEVEEVLQRARAMEPSLDSCFAHDVLSVFGGSLNPMACFVGGVAAQEVLKVCSGKFTPLTQWLYYDARELLQARGPSTSSSSSTSSVAKRYAGQAAVLGHDFQNYLSQQKIFIVGAGALGCELIKNAALMGLGGVSITDMDQIEMSNLSRQFLFRSHHIGQPKSRVAAAAAQEMCPQMHISSYEVKADESTEGIFNESFWDDHVAVLNALDNVVSRKYVDGRCLFYKKPLFESGTLGTKCNMQPVIPFVTESYSSTYDPPEKSVPLCTLKNFPNAIEHTIQWSSDLFHGLFHLTPLDVNRYIHHREAFEAELQRDPAAATGVRERVSEALREWPRNDQDCVRRARSLFNEHFDTNFRQLLHNIPLDKRGEDGQLFWSGAKKPPTPQTFDARHDVAIDFVFYTAKLIATVYGLPPLRMSREEVATYAASLELPAFVPKHVVIATTEKEAAASAAPAHDGAAIALPPVAPFMTKMVPQVFEKDDESVHHLQFVTYASNLRAQAYGIPTADLTQTKRIAGKIIPAMVTTTSLITGLVMMELIKYLLVQFRHGSSTTTYVPTPEEITEQLTMYRSAFINVALPFFAFSDPIMASGKTYMLPESQRRLRWGVWDRIDVDEGRDITVKELAALMLQRYELDVFMIALTSGKVVFMAFGGKAADREKPVSVVAMEKGEENLPGKDYLNLIATGTIGEEEEVDVPVIRYRFRNFATKKK